MSEYIVEILDKKGRTMNDQFSNENGQSDEVVTKNVETVAPGQELTERKALVLRDLRGEGQEASEEATPQAE